MSIELFHVIEEGVAHLRQKGVYREAKVYRRGKDIFARVGSGFVKRGPHGGTSVSSISWDACEAEGVFVTRVGGQPGWSPEQ